MPVGPEPNAGDDLIRIHKVITRGLNVSLHNCKPSKLSENLRRGFLTYVKVLTILVHAHHEGEDEISFPFWRKKFTSGPFDRLIEQHRQMITYLDRIEEWIKNNTSKWDDESLLPLFNVLFGLQTHWQTHIELEEETMGPGNCGKYLSADENVDLVKRLAEHGQAHANPPEIVMPFVVFNLEEEDRNVFVKLLPPVMMQQLIPVAWKPAWEPMMPFLLN
jgi:hemerythrin-like domain-containing protein